ncbi:MAG TPA: SRPBCC family protein [Acidimicrobiales bacterium]|nr:SRPBCC family protein [Acidimicrobiales bacterium]
MNEVSESIDIDAPADSVFRAVSDLPSMGQYSPENTGGVWLGGAQGPSIGAKFRGTNANGPKSWTTTSTVVQFDPPHTFAFEVTVGPSKVARWSYSIEPTASGCRVTESWIDRRGALSRWAGGKASGRSDRADFTSRSIRETLNNLKAKLESTS